MKRNGIINCLLINIVISSIVAYIVLGVPFPNKESIEASKKFESFIVGEGVILHDKEPEGKLSKHIKNNNDKAVHFRAGVTYKSWFLYYFMRFVVIFIILVVTSCMFLYLKNTRRKNA